MTKQRLERKSPERGERKKKAPRAQIRQDLADNLSRELERLYPQIRTKTERLLRLEKERGFSHSTAARILNQEKSPVVDRLDELAEALGIPTYRLLLPAARARASAAEAPQEVQTPRGVK